MWMTMLSSLPLEVVLLLYVLGTLLALTLAASLLQGWTSQQKSPPGPWGLPVIGSLLRLNPKLPYKSLRELVRQYGSVYRLWLGGVPAVVLAREDIIRATFAQEAASGRAPLYLTFGIMDGKGLICAEGELWREHRRFAMNVMRSLGMRGGAAKAALESKILDAATLTMKHLGHERKVSLVDPSAALLHSLGNGMNLLIFGIQYSREDPVWLRLQELLEEGTKLIGVAGAINFLPWLRFLPRYRRTIKFIKENQVKSHQVYQELIEKFQASEDTADGGEDMERDPGPKHFVDAYLKEVLYRGPGMEGSFTASQLHYVAADLFGAGTETTLTSIRWMLLDIAAHQKEQDLIYEELLASSGGQGFVTTSVVGSLVYTQAAMQESLRLHPVLPLGAPHGATKDLIIDGYHVPAGTMLIPLVDEVHHDSKHWQQPELFRPQRFIDPSTGQLMRYASFMPFQAGRRVCPGEDFARTMLLLYLTQFLLHYKILLPRDYASNVILAHANRKENQTQSKNNQELNVGLQINQNINKPKDSKPIEEDLDFGQTKDEDVISNHEDSDVANTVCGSGLECTPEYEDNFKEMLEKCVDDDPFAEPICGFTATARPYKLVLVPRY